MKKNKSKFQKKAQGLSLHTIVIAILVLIVLVILIYIFSSKIGGVSTSLSSCEDKGGECDVSSCSGPTVKTKECDDCCIPIGEEET